MIQILVLKVIVLLASCRTVQSQCEGLTMYNENGNVIASSQCMHKFSTDECLPFFNSFNPSDLPENFPRSESSVNKPSYINVEEVDTAYGHLMIPGLNITWESPLTDIDSCHGYLLVWYIEGDSNETKCRLFHTKTGQWMKFNYVVPFVHDTSEYTIRVYSMPSPGPQFKNDDTTFAESVFTTRASYKSSLEPAKWIPYMWTSVQTGHVILRFTLPPEKFKISRFTILMLNKGSGPKFNFMKKFDSKVEAVGKKVGTVTIPVTHPGYYNIVIWVEDEFRKVPGKCRCWYWKNKVRTCCGLCGGVLKSVYVTFPFLPVVTTSE